MKIKKHTTYYCDICGKEIKPFKDDLDGPFHFRYFTKTRYRRSKRMDICDDCRYKFEMWVRSNEK